MKMRALGLALAAGIALPQTALACYQLTQNVWMCAGETEWQSAKWDETSDGSTLVWGEYLIDFTEEFPGYHIRDDLTTPQEQFVTYLELAKAYGNTPSEIHLQDALDVSDGTAFRSLQRDRLEELETVSAVMLADISDARIMLFLDGPNTLAWDAIEVASRGMLNLLRDRCADAITCVDAGLAREVSE